MSATATAGGTAISLAAVIALATALGISTTNSNSLSDIDFKNDLIKKIENKSGKSIQEWWDSQEMGKVSEYSQIAEATKDTQTWDEWRNKHDRANETAETWGANLDPTRYMTEEQKAAAGATAGTAQPNNNGNGEEEKKDLAVTPSIPTIEEDSGTVGETVSQAWSLEDIKKYMEEAQAKQWEREDAIRKETQEREDTAYQRAVADMRKAGINPNLMNINPADSGGGITQATGLDMSTLSSRMTAMSNELIKILDREFNEDENLKDNITSLIGGLVNAFGMYMTFKKK